MTVKKINGHKVVLHDSPGELTLDRFRVFNQALILDSELGSGANDWNLLAARAVAFIEADRKREAQQIIQNAQQLLRLTVAGVNPKMNAFAALVQSIDGNDRNDLTEAGLNQTISILSKSGLTWNKMLDWIDEVKKNFTLKWPSFSRKTGATVKT
jgi:hypothetical protein